MGAGSDFNDSGDHASSGDQRLSDADFETFFRSNFVECCTYCQYQFGLDLDTAREAVHKAFIKLWSARDHVPAGPELRPYFKRIITNICLDMLRHEKVRKKHERYILHTHSSLRPDNHYQIGDFRHLQIAIDKAVSELPEQMRRIFEMSRYEELRYAEIAARLDISVKTVETQMSRALAKLRKRLSEYLIVCGALLLMLT